MTSLSKIATTYITYSGFKVGLLGANISEVRAGTQTMSDTVITDESLKELAKLMRHSDELTLPYADITDEGLKGVAKLAQLSSLNLWNAKTTHAGLADLARLEIALDRIQNELDLTGADITDEGLKEVAKMKQLKVIYLSDTQITEAGVSQLQQALPNCKIFHDSTPVVTSPKRFHHWKRHPPMMPSSTRRVFEQLGGPGWELSALNSQTPWYLPTPSLMIFVLAVLVALFGLFYGLFYYVDREDALREAAEAKADAEAQTVIVEEAIRQQLSEIYTYENNIKGIVGRKRTNWEILEHRQRYQFLMNMRPRGNRVSSWPLVDSSYWQILESYKGELTKEVLAKVTELYLGSGITDVGLREVAKHKQLTALCLYNCDEISDGGLKQVAKLTKLKKLFLPSQITHKGLKEVAKLQKLRCLDLYNMQINDEGLKVLAKMKQLSALNISSYKSADPETQALINLHLSSKNLSRQFFQPSPKSKKEALHRAPNKPTDVKRLGNLTQLTMLGLGGNQLTELPIGLEKLTQLTELDIGDNKLTDVKGLEKLTQLKALNLGGNQLTELPIGLENLTQLTKLWLGFNKLTDVSALAGLTQLKALDLGGNKLTELPIGLEKLTQLTELDIGDNILTDVKGLEKLTQLKALNLGGNQLTELPIGLEKLTQLKMLVLHSAPKPLNPDMPPWVRRRALPSYPTKAQIDQLQKALPNCTIRYHATK